MTGNFQRAARLKIKKNKKIKKLGLGEQNQMRIFQQCQDFSSGNT